VRSVGSLLLLERGTVAWRANVAHGKG